MPHHHNNKEASNTTRTGRGVESTTPKEGAGGYQHHAKGGRRRQHHPRGENRNVPKKDGTATPPSHISIWVFELLSKCKKEGKYVLSWEEKMWVLLTPRNEQSNIADHNVDVSHGESVFLKTAVCERINHTLSHFVNVVVLGERVVWRNR